MTFLDNIEPEAKLFGSRKDRGWGEVANASYGSFLDVLQTALYRDKPTKKGETLSATYQQLLMYLWVWSMVLTHLMKSILKS